MSGALFTKDVAVISLPVKTGEDHREKRGFVVKLAVVAGIICAALNDSATAIGFGVILNGENAGGNDSVIPFGVSGPSIKAKLGGNVTDLTKRLTQKSDGTFQADDNASARVVVAQPLELGSTDELIEVMLLTPRKLPALVSTADGSDAATTQALANALKASLNAFYAGT